MANFVAPRFTEQQARKVEDALQVINGILPVMDDMEACGMECQKLRADVEKKRLQFEKFRELFILKQRQ